MTLSQKKIKLNFITIFPCRSHEIYCKTWILDEEVFLCYADREVFYNLIVSLVLNLILSYFAMTISRPKFIGIHVARSTQCINP